jgi:hypothetical protein
MMKITSSRELTIPVGKIAEAEKWLSEGADLWKEVTGKDAVIYKEGWGDQYKMLFVTTYDSIGETEEVGEKAMADERIVEWILEGNKHNQYVYKRIKNLKIRKEIENDKQGRSKIRHFNGKSICCFATC